MSLQIQNKINIDFHDSKYISINAKQYDKFSRYVLVTCYNQGELIKLDKTSNGAFIRLRKPDDNGVFDGCEITDDGKILIELSEQILAVEGKCYADLVVVEKITDDGNITSELDNIFDMSLIDDDKGNVTLVSNFISAVDDNEGNVVLTISNFGEIIASDNYIILSTMTFCINVIRTAFGNAEIESSYEYNALNKLMTEATDNYGSIILACKIYEQNAKDYARESVSYTIGGTDTREDEDIDNAKYYYTQVKAISNNIDSVFYPMGTITYAELSTVIKETGYVYHISDEFTTDNTFKCGSGVSYPAGKNVYYTSDGYWDCFIGRYITDDDFDSLTQTIEELKIRVKNLENK